MNKNLICLIARIMAGGFMLFHGLTKLKGIGFIKSMMSGMHLPEFFGYGVYLGEIVGPLMILIGFRAKLGAVILIGNMIFIILAAHAGDIFKLNNYGGWAIELQMFYLLSAVLVYMLGAGKWAVSTRSVFD